MEPVLGYEASIECSPALIKPVKVFAKALHAHLTGRQIWAEQVRNGTVIAEFGREDHYTFTRQSFSCVTRNSN